MMELHKRLVSWAQNEEMINQYFTDHGKDCNEAADKIECLHARVEVLEGAMRKAANERYFNAALQVLADALATTEQETDDE